MGDTTQLALISEKKRRSKREERRKEKGRRKKIAWLRHILTLSHVTGFSRLWRGLLAAPLANPHSRARVEGLHLPAQTCQPLVASFSYARDAAS